MGETVAMLMKPYGYSMGILGFLVAGTTAKALTDSMNEKFTDEFSNELHVNNVGYNGEFLLLSADPSKDGGLLTSFMGTKDLLQHF